MLSPSENTPKETEVVSNVEEMDTTEPITAPEDLRQDMAETDSINTKSFEEKSNSESESNNKDVEKFDGKIVYNPDGSAYIIEDSDDESLPLIPKQEGSIIERQGDKDEDKQGVDAYPQIANAFYISKSTAYYNALYGQAYVKMMQEKNVPETPVVHSYRVFTARENEENDKPNDGLSTMPTPLLNYVTVPVKPILMCFICKLSFGCTQTFASHCEDEHSLELNEEERHILNVKNSSAIIQNVGKDRKTLVSFLEPILNVNKDGLAAPDAKKLSPPISPGAINHLLASAAAGLPKVPSIPPNQLPNAVEQQLQRSPGSGHVTPIKNSPLDESGRNSAAASPSTAHNSPSPIGLPNASLPLPSYPQLPTNANMLQGTTIGACPEHVNGRPTGVECSQCDLILNQSRMSGMGWNVSRNSCKTLKCPKCNWHYKYQETLEIHMKEKHPENETTCIYCITGQQHPRLTRGETYTCGYKPYRCEVCNYSTTTKGNLSIHMQSDKHLNNMQDLQNGSLTNSSTPSSESNKIGAPPPTMSGAGRNLATISSSPTPIASPSKQKNSYRCDVCNYETSVARNLRIHMTSEKHTHNVMSMQQQNAKSMTQLLAPGFPSLPLPPPVSTGFDPKQFLGGLIAAAGKPPTSTASEQAAMADLAYNQAVLAQIMSGGQFPGGPPPPLLPPPSSSPSSPSASASPDFAAIFAAAAASAAASSGHHQENTENNEPPPEKVDPNPGYLLSCCVCRDFSSDNLDEISQHLSIDRSRTREDEVFIVMGGNYLCQLCNYKTNLKANFQLHCKTDKHLQRLSHVNHIKEGGEQNEWKLRFLSNLNPVELRCNACDVTANSPHKLQAHFSTQQHQVSTLLFMHLKKCEQTSSGPVSYNCTLCPFSSTGKHALMAHVRSPKHLQMEQMHQLKKRAEGNMSQTDIGEIFQVSSESNDSENEEQENKNSTGAFSCPLCQENFDDQPKLENHAMSVHSVNSEGLHRLRTLINGSHWLNKNNGNNSPPNEEKGSNDSENDAAKIKIGNKNELNYSLERYLDPNRPFKCDVCKESFTQKNILLVHYNSVSHLNKLKKSMVEQPSKNESSSHEKTPSKGSALEALLGNISKERKDIDDEIKPYKCNICKVAYSQGSALDIHVRSVAHQSKASKLQELILTGQIDPSKPLIEQPDPQQDQQKKSDLLSPKSINSTGSTNSQSSPNVRSSSPNRSGSPQSSPLANLQALMGMKNRNASPITESSSGDENITNLAKNLPFLPNLNNFSSPEPQKPEEKRDEPAPVLKNLLQNYGLEMVKHFNELRNSKKDENDHEDNEDKNSNNDRSTPNSRPGLSEVQETLQKAMLQAQLQQMNPMLMQMSQLQGLNPLVAMNLQPPLIPPSLLNPNLAPNDLSKPQGPLGLMDPKLLSLMAGKQGGDNLPPNSLFPMNMDPKVGMQTPKMPFPSPHFGKSPPMPDPKTLLMQQQPVQNVDQGKRARTRITDDQLKVLRSNFDINNSPTEDQLNRMAAQTGLPLKVIKHWFRNTLFKERQKNKDSPYNFNNPPSTKLNLEEYEKTGEPKVTPLKPEDQADYVQESYKPKKELEKPMDDSPSFKVEQPEIGSKQRRDSSNDDLSSGPASKIPKLNESSSASEHNNLTLSQLLSSQFGHLPLPQNLLPNFPAFPGAPPTSVSPGSDVFSSMTNRLSNDQSPRPSSPQQGLSSGKRANRTRFTDYQIKILQEFFENNAYPKDDDLDYLSKLLGLSPRVIVVWFQNARQKARKIYENQPASDNPNPTTTTSAPNSISSSNSIDEQESRNARGQSCIYQCKKCLLVFQKYYELIRHQKHHCFKEEDAKRSAQAQKAAAQAAAKFAGSGNNSLSLNHHASEDSNSSLGANDYTNITSPAINLPTVPDDKVMAAEAERRGESNDMTKDVMNKLLAAGGLNYPPNSPFGFLQQQALQHQLAQKQANDFGESDDLDSSSLASSPSTHRKFSEDGEMDDEQRDKRLRTTILPEQLDFLYLKYQQESNPSRKMLEQIAGEVNLRKRVVQVWFQNARARERKGLPVKPNPGLIKRNGESDDDNDRNHSESHFPMSDQTRSLMHPNTPFTLPESMRQFYEDSVKRFMNDKTDMFSSKNSPFLSQHQGDPSALDLSSNFDDQADQFDDSDPNRSIENESLNGTSGGGNKRFRTQMSGVQVKMMRAIFEVYKTPTMTECSSLGQDIGLQKRVVQVWFQNARAKEKRAKAQLQQATGHEQDNSLVPEECKVCQFKYSHKFAVQDHIFTRPHLDNLRAAIESGRYEPECPGQSINNSTGLLQGGQRTPSSESPNPSLQMLQMTTTTPPQVNNRELLDAMSSHQNPRMLMQV